MRATYQEYQKIDQALRVKLLTISLVLVLLLILGDYLNLHLHFLWLISLVIVSLIYVLTLRFKFSTIIFSERIDIAFWPFFRTSIKISEITSIEVVTYDIAGFGVRYDLPNATTYYKACGKTALSLSLMDEKKVVIGTCNAEELKTQLEQLKLATVPVKNSN